jgi:hypothetical protein
MATVNRLKLSKREGVIRAVVASSPASPTRTLRLAILAASSLLALAIAANAKADDQLVSDSTSTEACAETCLDTASAGAEGDAPEASGLTADNGETLDPLTTDEGGAEPSGSDEVGPADDSPVTTDPSGDSEPPPPVTETLTEAPPSVEAPPVEAPPPVVPPPVDITPATDVPAPAEVSPPAEVLPPTETTASVTPSDVVPQELAEGSTTLEPQAAPPRPSIVVIDGPVVGSIPINPLVLALQRPSAAQSSGRSSATPPAAPSSGGRSSSGWTPESPRLPFPPSGPSAPAPGVAASAGAPGAGTFFLGFAVLVAAMSVGVSVRLSRRQLPSVAVWRPVAFVSPTERPG